MAKAKSGREVAGIVEELVRATGAKLRKPATRIQIAALERAWKRPLPPSYRAFLEISNGIDDDVLTHRLLGTEDQKWAKRQVDGLTEFWEDDDFDRSKVLPVDVPEAGVGIRNFAAFERGDAVEMPVVDWDTGRELKRFPTLAAYLEHEIALHHAVAKSREKEEKKAKVEKTKLDAGRTTLLEAKAISPSGPARKAAFGAIFELEAIPEIARAVKMLAAAKPSADEVSSYLERLERDLQSKSAAAFARAELVFAAKLAIPKTLRASWLATANNALARSFGAKDPKRSERWADVVAPHVRENAYLGHNLACAYVAVGRIDDAFAMAKVAVEVGYTQTSKMRTDPDLGPLLKEARFQKLFGPGDDTNANARTAIPRNPTLEAEVALGKSIAKYGEWLTKEESPLGAVVASDLAAEKSPNAKKTARARFAAYRKEVLDQAFPKIAKHFTPAVDPASYFSFRYGFLEKLDTFPLNTAGDRAEALALLGDPHGMFVKHVALRGAKLDSFELFSRLPALRRIQNRWTDITQVSSLAPLEGLTQLRALDLRNSKVSDLRPLAKLPILQLYLDKSAVVDLSPLAHHPTLSCLTLDGTKVKDLSPLLTCPKLCSVNLYGVKIDQKQVDALDAYVTKAKNDYVKDDAIMDGYSREVFHG